MSEGGGLTGLDALAENEVYVRHKLSFFETEFRQMCLSLLCECSQYKISLKGIYAEIASLQKPSWGCWNGFLHGILHERRNLLNTGSAGQREALGKAEALSWASLRLEQPEELPDSVMEDCMQTGILPNKKNRKNVIKAREIFALLIEIRNRVAHDNPSAEQWWVKIRAILEAISCWYDNSGISEAFHSFSKREPWLVENNGEVWSFNGIDLKSNAVTYVSLSGGVKADTEKAAAVMLAFQQIMGEQGMQEDNFKKLMNRLTPEDLRGFILGGYLVGEKAGEGGFAEVFKGIQLSTGRHVAIKILKAGLTDTDKLRFLKEAEYLSRFDNPNIVKIYDHDEQPWRKSALYDLSQQSWFTEFKKKHGSILTYIAMEWVEGKTLDDIFLDIKKGNDTYSEKEIAQWFSQASSALEVIHSANLIHRDITPKNIMVTEPGTVKLMDFGISRTMYENRTIMTSPSVMLGCEPYMSPEQLNLERAGAELGPHSDIYSLGATFYELFTGTRLYNHNNDAVSIATASKMKRNGEKPRSPRLIKKGLSWEISIILMGCLETDPADRYKNAQKLYEDINRYLGNLPIEYKKPTAARRLQLFYRRKHVVVNISAVFVLLILVSTMVYLSNLNAKNIQLQDTNGKLLKTNNQLTQAKSDLTKSNKALSTTNLKLTNTNIKLKKTNDELTDQINETNTQRSRADRNATEANAQRDEAQRQTVIAQQNATRAEKQRDLAMGMIKKLTYDIAPQLYNLADAKPLLSDMLTWNTQNINEMLNLEPNSAEGMKSKVINYYLIGDTWNIMGNYGNAEQAYKNGLSISKQLLSGASGSAAKLQYATGCGYISSLEVEQCDFSSAVQNCLKGISTLESGTDGQETDAQYRQELNTCYDYLGRAYLGSNDLGRAYAAFKKELGMRRDQVAKDDNILTQTQLAVCLSGLAHTESAMKDYTDSKAHISEELSIIKKVTATDITPQIKQRLKDLYTDLPYISVYFLGDIDKFSAYANGDYALSAYDNGDYKTAIAYFGNAFDKMDKLSQDNGNINAKQQFAIFCSNMGICKIYSRDTAGSLPLFEKAVALQKTVAAHTLAQSDIITLGGFYYNTGYANQLLGNKKAAMVDYGSAYSILNGARQSDLGGDTLLSFALCCENIADIESAGGKSIDDAFSLYNKSVALRKTADLKNRKNPSLDDEIAFDYMSIGFCDEMKNDLRGALSAYQTAAATYGAVCDRQNSAAIMDLLTRSYDSLGKVQEKLGKFADEQKTYTKKAALDLKIRDTGVNNSATLADDYKALGDISKNSKDYQNALKNYKQEQAMRTLAAGTLADMYPKGTVTADEKNQDLLAESDMEIGDVEIDFGDVKEAFSSYIKADMILFVLGSNTDDKPAIKDYATVEFDMGWISEYYGCFTDSLSNLTEAKDACMSLTINDENSELLYNICMNRSTDEMALSKFDDALGDVGVCRAVTDKLVNTASVNYQRGICDMKCAKIMLYKNAPEKVAAYCDAALKDDAGDGNITLYAGTIRAAADAMIGELQQATDFMKTHGSDEINIAMFTSLSTSTYSQKPTARQLISGIAADLKSMGLQNAGLEKILE